MEYFVCKAIRPELPDQFIIGKKYDIVGENDKYHFVIDEQGVKIFIRKRKENNDDNIWGGHGFFYTTQELRKIKIDKLLNER